MEEWATIHVNSSPGAAAQSEAAPGSIPSSGTFLRRDLVMHFSTAIFPPPLIQEEQLSVTGERMCTKYW